MRDAWPTQWGAYAPPVGPLPWQVQAEGDELFWTNDLRHALRKVLDFAKEQPGREVVLSKWDGPTSRYQPLVVCRQPELPGTERVACLV